ncbi:hypothetical protein PGB90_005326 [Kerria lacca]
MTSNFSNQLTMACLSSSSLLNFWPPKNLSARGKYDNLKGSGQENMVNGQRAPI